MTAWEFATRSQSRENEKNLQIEGKYFFKKERKRHTNSPPINFLFLHNKWNFPSEFLQVVIVNFFKRNNFDRILEAFSLKSFFMNERFLINLFGNNPYLRERWEKSQVNQIILIFCSSFVSHPSHFQLLCCMNQLKNENKEMSLIYIIDSHCHSLEDANWI